jgi:hypothetical protein
MEKIQYGEMATADFHENTITFEMREVFTVCGGEFAIVRLDSLQDKIALEDFIETLNK